MGKYEDCIVQTPLGEFVVKSTGASDAEILVNATQAAAASIGISFRGASVVFPKKGKLKIQEYDDNIQGTLDLEKKDKNHPEINRRVIKEILPLMLKTHQEQKEYMSDIFLCFPIDARHTVFIADGRLQKDAESGDEMPMQIMFDHREKGQFIRVMAPTDSDSLNTLRRCTTKENNVTIGLGGKVKGFFEKSTEELAEILKFNIVLKKDSETVLPGKTKKCIMKRLCVHSEQFGYDGIAVKAEKTLNGMAELGKSDFSMKLTNEMDVIVKEDRITFQVIGNGYSEKTMKAFKVLLGGVFKAAGIGRETMNTATVYGVKSMYEKSFLEKLSSQFSSLVEKISPEKKEEEKVERKPFVETAAGKALVFLVRLLASTLAFLWNSTNGGYNWAKTGYRNSGFRKAISAKMAAAAKIAGGVWGAFSGFCSRHANAIYLCSIAALAVLLLATHRRIGNLSFYEAAAIIGPGLVLVALLSWMNPRESLVAKIGDRDHAIIFVLMTTASFLAVKQWGVDVFVRGIETVAAVITVFVLGIYAISKNQERIKGGLSVVDGKLDDFAGWLSNKKLARRFFSNMVVKAAIRLVGAIIGIIVSVVLAILAIPVTVICFLATFGDRKLYQEMAMMEKRVVEEIHRKYRDERPTISPMCEVSFDVVACKQTVVALFKGGVSEFKSFAGNNIPDEFTLGGFKETSLKLVTGKWVNRFIESSAS